jgi:hypothetical protein
VSTAETAAVTVPGPPAMALLASGVPLSLLLDIVCGPRSEELMAAERPADVPRQRRA